MRRVTSLVPTCIISVAAGGKDAAAVLARCGGAGPPSVIALV